MIARRSGALPNPNDLVDRRFSGRLTSSSRSLRPINTTVGCGRSCVRLARVLSLREFAVCCPLDEMSNSLRLRYVHSMTSLHLDHLGAGTLRYGSLSVGRNHPVFRRNEVRSWAWPSRPAQSPPRTVGAFPVMINECNFRHRSGHEQGRTRSWSPHSRRREWPRGGRAPRRTGCPKSCR